MGGKFFKGGKEMEFDGETRKRDDLEGIKGTD
jgi:hypothetical protein